MHKPQVIAIVQVRLGATRLPGKPLKTVLNRPLLSYQLERLARSKTIDKIVVATTTNPSDQAVVDLCRQEGMAVFRGSEQDVLERYYQAAKHYAAEVVIRVTGDCPLIDPEIVDKVVGYFLEHYPHVDYVSNTLKLTYPRGLDVEVFSFKNLERAYHEAKRPEEREHVSPYFYEHPELFALANVAHSPNEAQHRWTVDTPEDLQLISKVIETLYVPNPHFNMQDVLNLLQQHPQWKAINAHIVQKPLR